MNFSPTGDNKGQLYTWNNGRATYNNITSTKGLKRNGGGGEIIVTNNFSCSGPYIGIFGGSISVGGTATFRDSATFDGNFTAETLSFEGIGATYLLSETNTLTASTMNIVGGSLNAPTFIKSKITATLQLLKLLVERCVQIILEFKMFQQLD